MDKIKEGKKIMTIVGIVTFVVVEIIGLCCGKVIEGSLFAEIAKWIFMGLGIAILAACLSFTLTAIYVSRKEAGLDQKNKK